MAKKVSPIVAIKNVGKVLWEHKETVAKLEADFQRLGYHEESFVSVAEMKFVKAELFLHEQERIYAVLYDEAQTTWIDLLSIYPERGASEFFCATNASAPLLGLVAQRPTYFVSLRLPNVTLDVLHEEFLRARPGRPATDVSRQAFPVAFSIVCIADSAWQKTNLSGRGADKKMQRIVAEAYQQARAVRMRRPEEEMLLLLSGLRVPDQALPKQTYSSRPATAKKSRSLMHAFVRFFEDSSLLMGQEPEEPLMEGDAREPAIGRALQLIESDAVRKWLLADQSRAASYLDLAVATGDLKIVQAMIDLKLPQDILSGSLMGAAGSGFRDLVEMLLNAGADAKYKGHIGYTALISAARCGDPEIVERLIAAGADVRARTEGGETAKTAASGPLRQRICELLDQSAKAKTTGKETAIKTVKAKKPFDPATARGVEMFQKAMGHPEWSMCFIEAAPAAVAKVFAELHPEAEWHKDTASRKLIAAPPLQLLFRLRDNAWSVLLRTVGWLSMEDLKELPEDARQLSARLKTRAVTFLAEDTSSCEGYEIFANGESVETADWMGEVRFKSKLRRKVAFKDNFPEPVFSELGIFLPQCWPDHDGYETKLLLGGVSPQAVERLDCFKFKSKDE